MKTSPRPPGNSALTLIEVILVLGSATILVALLLTAFARGPRRIRQTNCSSNLKQIGLAWISWAYDHESPEFPFRTAVADEGTMGNTGSLKNNAWWQFTAISNELNTPIPLVCPADKDVGEPRNIATHWGRDPNGGFMCPGYRHRATSYTIGLEAAQPKNTHGSSQILATDRSILFDGRDGACSSGVSDARLVRVKGRNGQNPPAAAAWTNAIHRMRGNVLTQDGTVQQMNTAELDALCDLNDDNGSIHFLVPK